MINLRRHTNIALLYFFIVGLLGLFLRFFFVTPLEANFRYVVHAHSHIALLGWVYIGLSTLIYKMYFTGENKGKRYLQIFIFTQITLIGMLFTFPIQGYALFSIIFSTLFLFASYFFAWFVFRNIPLHFKKTYSYNLIRSALWFMVISSIGPWAISVVMVTLGSTSIWYKLSIYFYLHFQYNGWFLLALTGILFYLLENSNAGIKHKEFKRFFHLMIASIILSFFLSVLWVEPPLIFYMLAGAGAILQIFAFWKLFYIIRQNSAVLKSKLKPFTLFLLTIVGIFLVIKILMQLLTAFPYFVILTFNIIDFVVGYLHWVFLGIVSISLFAFLGHFGLLKISRPVFYIYLTGFILSEALIFYKGLAIWLALPFFGDYFLLLVLISALIPMAVLILLFQNINTSKILRKQG